VHRELNKLNKNVIILNVNAVLNVLERSNVKDTYLNDVVEG
jgi:hypothetical protein